MLLVIQFNVSFSKKNTLSTYKSQSKPTNLKKNKKKINQKTNSKLLFAASIAVYTVLYVIITYMFAMNDEEKSKLRRVLRR